jgi:uncharacterized protein
MPYKFTFDLSKIPALFFAEIAKVGYHKRVGVKLQQIISRFKIEEITGLNLSDAVMLLQDFADIQAENLAERKRFDKTKSRALFLPHCSRKYMDSRCKASFNQNTSSFECAHCSGDCLVGRAAVFAEKRNYDVYILPGGSCISKILKAKRYEGIIGVACCNEIKAGVNLLKHSRVSSQTVPLIKNGCANTRFNLETLFRTLERA